MRIFSLFLMITMLSGCSLFGSYAWVHPEKTERQQLAERSECVALSSIVHTSPEALLALAESGKATPNPRLEADCLASKGYSQIFIPKKT